MHCYSTFAATTFIAHLFATLPQIGRNLSQAEIAAWMDQHGIEPESVLFDAPEVTRQRLIELVERERPEISRAA